MPDTELDCTWCNGPTELPDPDHPNEEVLGQVLQINGAPLHKHCVRPYGEYLRELAEANKNDPPGSWFLVEEQHGSDLGGLTQIEHWFLRARTAKEAFLGARKYALAHGKEYWYFGADELNECIKGYLWAAADGSSVCYEVRKIGRAHDSGWLMSAKIILEG